MINPLIAFTPNEYGAHTWATLSAPEASQTELSFRFNHRGIAAVLAESLCNLEAVGLDCAFVLAQVTSNRGGGGDGRCEVR